MSYFGFLTTFRCLIENSLSYLVRNLRGDKLSNSHGSGCVIQKVTEKIVDLLVRKLSETYSTRNICLAGGVALNCVANGKLLKKLL